MKNIIVNIIMDSVVSAEATDYHYKGLNENDEVVCIYTSKGWSDGPDAISWFICKGHKGHKVQLDPKKLFRNG